MNSCGFQIKYMLTFKTNTIYINNIKMIWDRRKTLFFSGFFLCITYFAKKGKSAVFYKLYN